MPPATGTDLLFIPGLGGDERQFAPQLAEFSGARVARWIEPERGESLADYALRLGTAHAVNHQTIVAGTSLGGMIALEIARQLRPRTVVLIGSCHAPSELVLGSRSLAYLTASAPPRLLASWMRGTAALGARVLGARTHAHRELLVTMLRATPPAFIQWAFGAIASWPGCPDPGVPCLHIHGNADRIIPARRTCADELVAGAGHILNLTHARHVNAFIARHCFETDTTALNRIET